MADQINEYGFTFGPATVERMWRVEGHGRCLRVKTPHAEIEVYITEAGRRIRVFDKKRGELLPSSEVA